MDREADSLNAFVQASTDFDFTRITLKGILCIDYEIVQNLTQGVGVSPCLPVSGQV